MGNTYSYTSTWVQQMWDRGFRLVMTAEGKAEWLNLNMLPHHVKVPSFTDSFEMMRHAGGTIDPDCGCWSIGEGAGHACPIPPRNEELRRE